MQNHLWSRTIDLNIYIYAIIQQIIYAKIISLKKKKVTSSWEILLENISPEGTVNISFKPTDFM